MAFCEHGISSEAVNYLSPIACFKGLSLTKDVDEDPKAEGTDEQHIIEIAFDSFENKRFHDPDVLYPYLKEQIKNDGMQNAKTRREISASFCYCASGCEW